MLLEYAGLIGNVIGFAVAAIIMAATMRTTLTQLQTEVVELKKQVRSISDVLTKLAVQQQRLDTMDKRIDGHDQIIDDLRRGEGFIMPLGHRGGS